VQRLRAPALASVLMAARIASAQPSSSPPATLPLDLDWRAPEECYSAEMVRAELNRIAHPRPGRVPEKLSARGRIDKRGDVYHLTLTTERNGTAGERTLSASDCRALGREVTLVLALAFGEGVELVPDDEAAAAPEPDPAPPPKKPAPEAPKAAPPRDVTPPPEPDRERRAASNFRVSVYLGGGVLFRALPDPALQGVLGAQLGTTHWWLEPRLSLLPRVEERLQRGVDARYDGLGGGLGACAGTALGPTLWSGCALVSATALRGRSSGTTDDDSAIAPWYSAGPLAAFTWPEPSTLALRLEGALLGSLNQPQFTVGGLGEAHTVPRFVASAALGLVLRPGQSHSTGLRESTRSSM
jgi:hypothetical protein